MKRSIKIILIMLSIDDFKSLKINNDSLFMIKGGKKEETSYKGINDTEWKDGDVYDTDTKITSYPDENWSDSKEDL